MGKAPKPNEDQLALFADEPMPGEYKIPEGGRPGECRSCGEPIVWAKTENDRWIPLATKTARDINGERWATTHYADCPQSREWKRR